MISNAIITPGPAIGQTSALANLGPGFYAARIDPERRKRNHIRQLEALGYKVSLDNALAASG